MPVKISAPSAQSLLLQTSVNGNALSTATGFVCMSRKGPVLITNWHVVTGRHLETQQPLSPTGGIPDSIHVMHNKKGEFGSWMGRLESLKGEPWFEHSSLGEKADLVALPLTNLGGVQLLPYELPPMLDVLVRPSDPISVVGFPFGMSAAGGFFAVWATGFMASEPDLDYRNLPIFLVDCRTRPGQSGSAVIFHSNGGLVRMANGDNDMMDTVTRLLGVYGGRINDQSDIGMVWKTSAIQQLIDSI